MTSENAPTTTGKKAVLVPPETAILAPQSTLALAIQHGMDPVTIGKLMDLQERWEANQARKEYVEAMSNFKRECPAVIGKDRKADFGPGKAKYTYATTAAIVTAITPALSKHGLSLSWETKQEIKLVTVTCHVTHAGGHRESATLTGPHDSSGGKNEIQMLGSSVHYLQRYTMVSVLGLATADMDDPDAAETRPPVAMPQERREPGQTAQPPAPGKEPGNADAPGESAVEGLVEDVDIRTGKNTKGDWTKYGVKVNGQYYGTFSDTDGKAALNAKEAAAPVRIAYATDDKGRHNIASLTVKAGF